MIYIIIVKKKVKSYKLKYSKRSNIFEIHIYISFDVRTSIIIIISNKDSSDI